MVKLSSKKMIPTMKKKFEPPGGHNVSIKKQPFGLSEARKRLNYYSFYFIMTRITPQKHLAIHDKKIFLIFEKNIFENFYRSF
jgi:hypothetical protein